MRSSSFPSIYFAMAVKQSQYFIPLPVFRCAVCLNGLEAVTMALISNHLVKALLASHWCLSAALEKISQESGVLFLARVVQYSVLFIAPGRTQYSSADLLYLTLKTMISTSGWGDSQTLCSSAAFLPMCVNPASWTVRFRPRRIYFFISF